jgi:DNA-binding LytR/AlgR family response regulator
VNDGADLAGLRILIVEDEFLLARELEIEVQERGGTVLGPVASVGEALTSLDAEQPDIALLDINPKGENVTPVAAALQARGPAVRTGNGLRRPAAVRAGTARRAANRQARELRRAAARDRTLGDGTVRGLQPRSRRSAAR